MKQALTTLALALLLAAASAANVFSRQHYEANYQEWLQQYNTGTIRPHASGDDYVKKLDTFADNSDAIMKHNKGNHSWTMGHNEFSDMTWAEFKQQFINKPLPADKPTEVNDFADAPKANSFDWRKKGCVTSVKRQQCGDCWSFSAAGAMEGAYCIAGKGLNDMSSQHLVDCDDNDSGCSGGLPTRAFSWLKGNGGICSLKDYPYRGGKEGSCKKCTPQGKVKGYSGVKQSDKSMTAAINQQPIAIGVDADGFGHLYQKGVFKSACEGQLNHAVLAVGYGTDGDDDYYLVKNSWGSSWGEGGYIRFQKGKDGSRGKCGMLMDGSYPNV